jgi:hypothetical protein
VDFEFNDAEVFAEEFVEAKFGLDSLDSDDE